MSLVVLIGGARSGKSRLAVSCAGRAGAPVVFVATGAARDEEMAERIARHRAERPGAWETVEEPLEVERALAAVPGEATAILDCLSLWVSNMLEEGRAAQVEPAAAAAARHAASRPGLTVAVTNEVGLGIVPAYPLGRSYRDLLGRVNAIWATEAADAYFVVAGRALRLEAMP